jgi:hypothetical protein
MQHESDYPNPAQRQLVHRFIDWGIVEQRLQRFPAIDRAFPVELLRSHQETPPYYCHYMAWRLGTWNSESLFVRLDELLAGAEKLPSWSAEKPLLKSPDFSCFWSLVWQLQVAEYLLEIGSGVQWASSGGPDLSAQVESETWYVECYTYHKSFSLVLFIEELLQQVDGSIRVQYDLCMPFSLPKDRARSEFLDRTLSDFINPAYIERARSMALVQYPVVLLTECENSLVVYMEGRDPAAYVPGIVPNRTGDSQRYLKVVLSEAIRAKQNANLLDKRHPNLVAVNFSLSADTQFALNRADGLKLSIPEIQLDLSHDAVAVAVIGINERLERSRFRRIAPAVVESLALDRLTDAP